MNDRSPHVSIVVPVFNGARYLRESLESIVDQTYQSTEILVMDDASTDATPAIIQSFGDRVQCHRQTANRGIYGNTNDGIALARGDYIAVYHGDDIYDPRMVEREVAFLEQYPAAGAVFCKDIFIDALGEEFGRLQLPSELRGGRPLDYATVFNALLKYKNRFLCCPTAMVRASVHREVGVYRDAEFRNSADLDMWLRIARKYPIGILEEYLLRYRRGHGSSAQRYHHLRTDPERYFTIMDLHLRDGGADVARAESLAAYEAHRAEDTLLCGMNAYISGDTETAGRILNEVRVAALLGSNQIQRPRLLILLLALRLAVRLPRMPFLADALARRRIARQREAAAAGSGIRT